MATSVPPMGGRVGGGLRVLSVLGGSGGSGGFGDDPVGVAGRSPSVCRVPRANLSV